MSKGILRLPRPAMVVACIALLVSLGGTAVAATPTVKRALFANNAGKLQGKTAAQIAALPGPASSAAGLLVTKSQSDSLAPQAEREITISCDAGKKIVSAGFSATGPVIAFDTRPTSDTSWAFYLANLSNSQGSSVTLNAICMG